MSSLAELVELVYFLPRFGWLGRVSHGCTCSAQYQNILRDWVLTVNCDFDIQAKSASDLNTNRTSKKYRIKRSHYDACQWNVVPRIFPVRPNINFQDVFKKKEGNKKQREIWYPVLGRISAFLCQLFSPQSVSTFWYIFLLQVQLSLAVLTIYSLVYCERQPRTDFICYGWIYSSNKTDSGVFLYSAKQQSGDFCPTILHPHLSRSSLLFFF